METADELANLRAYIDATRADWKVPGMAVGIVRDGRVTLAEGFGLRNAADGLPVTPRTLFAIGSATKAFTATAVGILVSDGKLAWDTPVREFLPSFKLADPFASERMTPRDLLTHRSGLPRHDLMWYNSSATRQELFDRLRYLEPSKDLRTTFQYQNLMYMTAGYLAGVVSGGMWEDVVRERIFTPLGMTSANFSVARSQQSPDYSLPYQEKHEQVGVIPFRPIDTIGPAGSINASLDGMLQWLRLQLDHGRHNDRQIIAASDLAQMHAPQMVVQDAQFRMLFQADLLSYGLGWFIQSYKGHLMVQHGGNIDGFTTLVSFLPQDGIGIVILSNLNGTLAPTVVTYTLYDRLLGLAPSDWNGQLKQVDAQLKAAIEQGKATTQADRQPDTHPSHPLAAYAGEYAHPGYGVASVEPDGEALRLSYNALPFTMTHYHYDTFEIANDQSEVRMKLTFQVDAQGRIARLALPLEPSVADIVFVRQPDRRMRQRAFLERFTGDYSMLTIPARVALRGEDALVVSVPGQPDQELVPYDGTTFTVKGQEAISVRFVMGDDGQVREALLIQPGATLTLTRVEPGA
jgi:CubicO group peptidase (beta-lactamase class C family)